MVKGWTGTEAARVAKLTYRKVDYWARTSVVKPSVQASGKGSRRGYSFLDLVALRTVAELRREGVSLQAIRRVQAALKRFKGSEADFANSQLAVLHGTKLDVLLVDEEHAVSLVRDPGQYTARQFFDLAPVVRAVVEGIHQLEAERGRQLPSRKVANG